MADQWPDIPGVTAVDGRPRLPRQPATAARALKAVVQACGTGPPPHAAVAEALGKATGAEPARLLGLLGWLPLSRVAWWDRDGTLRLDPDTDVTDLAVRYAAWVSTQAIPATHAEQMRRYAKSTVELASAASAEVGPPATTRPAPPEEPPEPEGVRRPILDEAVSRKVRKVLDSLDAAFLERSEAVRATLLALLSGQHALLLGPPGTAKSMLARSLCDAFADATYFEYLLSKFTHPDELFGPVSIPGLKDEDYRRMTEGFLPRAHVAFLDEIFKANSAILNSLLTLVNERLFHHGRHRDPVPLIGLIGASNELPDPEGGLAALYDRFLVRVAVPPVKDAESFVRVAKGDLPTAVPADRITAGDRAAILAASENIAVPAEVEDALVALWQAATAGEWGVSDRRWRQAVTLLKVAAATDGRDRLIGLDLLLLVPCLAPDPAGAAEVRQAVLQRLGRGGIPQHDLRAQWMLLAMDRVAPCDGEALGRPPPHYAPWRERLAIRRANLQRFLTHHREAMERLVRDRDALEEAGRAHVWLGGLHAALLAPYLDGMGDLARILRVAEGYGAELESPTNVARALLTRLPQAPKRVFGQNAVIALAVDGSEPVRVTSSGEAEPPQPPDGPVDPSSRRDNVPVLTLTSATLLSWLEGAEGTETILAAAPAWAARDASMALSAIRRHLGNNPIPQPPDLPAP